MAIVSDIQLQDSVVKPSSIATSCKFTFAGLTASSAIAVSETVPVSTTGLITAKSASDVCAFFETSATNGGVAIYLNIDKGPAASDLWALRVAGTASDSFIISNSKGAHSTCQFSALSVTPAGAVGIGKTGAGAVLDIAYATPATGGINIVNTTDNITTKITSETASGSVGTISNSKLGFRTNADTVGTFDTNGRFGVGTDSPAALLDVRGSAIFNEGALDVDFRIEGNGESNLFFVDASADKIGIGTATPGNLVHIEKDSNAATAAEIKNTTAGTAAVSKLVLTSDAGAGAFTSHSSTFTTSNQAIADAVLLESDSTSSGGLHLSAAGSNEMGFWTGSTRRATFTSGGCIGIGISTPDGLVHVYAGLAGTVAAASTACNLVVENSTAGGVSILVPNASAASLAFGSPADSLGAEIKHTQSSTTMEVGTKESGGILKLNSADGTNAIYIDASQNVGIGTAVPGVPLRVQGNACFTGTLTAANLAGGGSSLWLSGTDLIYTTGNCIGIGTDAASADLHLMKNQNAVTDVLVQNTTAGTGATATIQLSADAGSVKLEALSSSFTTSNAAIADAVLLESASTSSGGLHMSAAGANELALWTNNSRRVTITSAGCVGIGTATTSDEEFKVQGDACITGTMYADTFSGGGVTDNVWIMSGQDAYFKELSAGDNIGIGTTIPAHTLHVGGNAASAPALLVCDSGGQRIEVTGGAVKINNAYTMPAADGSAGEVICTDGSDTLTFGPGGYWTCVAGPELYYTGGNVGIGTAAPDGSLHVMSASAGTITADANADELVIEGSGNAGLTILSANSSQGNIAFGDDGNAKQGIFGFHQGNAEFNWSQATQQMVLDSSGKLGIGTATPSHLLDVEGVGNFLTCTVTPDVCATTKVVGAIVCSAGVLCTATDLCAGADVHAATCIVTPTLCASSALTVAAGTVAGAPSGVNDIAPKCYIDAQIAAGGSSSQSACYTATSTTWTVPSGVDWIWLTLMGSGGGGAGGWADPEYGSSGLCAGGGGGGGGAAHGVGLYSFPLYVGHCTTIGLCAASCGGAGGPCANGGDGVCSCFMTRYAAGRGSKGVSSASPIYGGVAGTTGRDDSVCINSDVSTAITSTGGSIAGTGAAYTMAAGGNGGAGGNGACCGGTGATGASGQGNRMVMVSPNCGIGGVGGISNVSGSNFNCKGGGGGAGGGDGWFGCAGSGGLGGCIGGAGTSASAGGGLGYGGGGGGGGGTNGLGGSGSGGGHGLVLINYISA